MNEHSSRSDAELEQFARRIELAHHADFDLGAVRVKPSLRRITGPYGDQMLEPKVMQVLIALSDPIGAILSRNDLIDRCWGGRVVGENSINRVISLLRSALAQVAQSLVVVQNVPKVGYRLIVDAPAKDEEQTHPAGGFDGRSAPASPEPQVRSLRRAFAAGAALLVILGLAATFLSLRPLEDGPLPEVQMAILPLETAEGVDPIYAAGLESKLRGEFARVGSIRVIATQSAKMLLEQGLSPAQIGRRLGVDYVWTGYFAVEAERAALDIVVIDVETQEEMRIETLRSAPDDTQHLPFRTARSVSRALGRPVRITPTPDTLPAGDFRLYLVANGLLKSRDRDQVRAAREVLSIISNRNPEFAESLGSLAMAYFLSHSDDPAMIEANREKARQIAERAVAKDPDTIEALKVLGMLAKDPETALSNLGRAVELDPGDSEGWFWLTIVQRRFVLDGGNPLESAQKLLDIDPLWPAAWQGPALAAEFGDIERARDMERQILAASVTPSQRLLVEARLARLDGDFSEFYRLTQRAAQTNTTTERMFSQTLLDRAIRILLDLPATKGSALPLSGAPQAIMQKLNREVSVSRGELVAKGLTGKQAWDDLTFIAVVMPLYLKNGLANELLADYDARFASHSDFLAFTQEADQPDKLVSELSPHLFLALREAGREPEARQHLALLKNAVQRMRKVDRPWLDRTLAELKLAAITNDTEKAVAMIGELPKFGWPYSVARINPTAINLLRSDPLFDNIRNLPEVRAVLDPIRANLAKERKEVLQLGVA
ncbi:MAG: winged helix-turn-helix domain-containing protein [Erythrobacter sp.]|nr:winged helix-turn-helix domain-containing protein [Erythrobacter sp.]